MTALAPGHRYADCRCGHPKSPDHDRPGFELQCTHAGCTCVQYRPNMEQAAQRPALAHTPPPSLVRPPVEPGIAVRGERPPPLELLLQAGKRSSIARTVALTEKIALLLHDLRGRLTDERQSAEEKARRVEEEQVARADVARLTAELEAAKAKLRGRTPPQNLNTIPCNPAGQPRRGAWCSDRLPSRRLRTVVRHPTRRSSAPSACARGVQPAHRQGRVSA